MKTLFALCIVIAAAASIPYAEGAVVRAWGEPHIWAYRQPYVVTCGAPGWQTYLNNEYMQVMAYNHQKYATSAWTVMTQILIFLKNPSDGSIMATYYAPDSTAPLPTAFLSPAITSVSSPSSPAPHQVYLGSWGSTYVIIRHQIARTVIVLGGKRGNIILSMVAALPNVLAEVSSGFLIDGCPAGHVISGSPGRRRRSVGCDRYRTLMGACLYDAEGLDEEFALAAASAVTNASKQAADYQQKLNARQDALEQRQEVAEGFDEPLPQLPVEPAEPAEPVEPVRRGSLGF